MVLGHLLGSYKDPNQKNYNFSLYKYGQKTLDITRYCMCDGDHYVLKYFKVILS